MFVTPCCRRVPVQKDRTDPSLECVGCGRRFLIEDDIFKFDVINSTHGEFSKEEMREILNRMAVVGWREALRTDVQQRNPRVVSLINDPRRARSVAPITEAPGERVLDFGCGYGGVAIALADTFNEVVALDESMERLSVLGHIKHQDGLDNITLVCHHDVLHLPFSDNHFDAVVLVGVLEYLPASVPGASIKDAHDRCLREFRRVLRRGGHIWVLTKNRFGWQFIQGQPDHSGIRFATVLPRRLTDLISRIRGLGAYRTVNYSLQGYRGLFASNGFVDIRLYWPIPGYQAPDQLVSLDTRLMPQGSGFDYGGFGRAKLTILRVLDRLGLLPWVVPYYGVLARKP